MMKKKAAKKTKSWLTTLKSPLPPEHVSSTEVHQQLLEWCPSISFDQARELLLCLARDKQLERDFFIVVKRLHKEFSSKAQRRNQKRAKKFGLTISDDPAEHRSEHAPPVDEDEPESGG